MLKALAWKEFRELLPLVAVALVAQFYFVSTAAGVHLALLVRNRGTIPFVGDGYATWLIVVAGLAGVAFGLWQTLRESSRGTYQYLLHRPMRRDTIFGAKLLVGGAAVAMVAFLPMLVYALWAGAPGTHASPFQWSMTTEAWQDCLQVPVLYLGAFVSGLRPARWFGSRLFPLAGTALVLLVLEALPGWQWTSLVVCLGVDACLVLVIFYVAHQRDYS